MKRYPILLAALLLLVIPALSARAEDDINDLLYSALGQQRNTQAGLTALMTQAASELAANPGDYGLLWKYAALNYYQGEFYSTLPGDKKKFFTACKDYADQSVRANAQGIAGHYWLGVGLAKWAEANGVLYSLFSAGDILREMSTVIKMDPAYFKGLPFSIRASVYALAPGVISVGDWDKAREDIKSALQYGKEYRSNYLILSDVYVSWSDWDNAKKLIDAGLAMPFDARLPLEESDCIKKLQDRQTKIEAEIAKLPKK